MNHKTRLLTIVLLCLVVGLLVYLPLTRALEPNEETGSELTIGEIQQDKPLLHVAFKVKLAWWFLNHSEPVVISGTAVNLYKNMLIVRTTEDQIMIHLPSEWTIGDELVLREELFVSNYLSVGENVIVKVLKANLVDKEGLRIYVLVGYEIINESGDYAYANLRINIED